MYWKAEMAIGTLSNLKTTPKLNLFVSLPILAAPYRPHLFNRNEVFIF